MDDFSLSYSSPAERAAAEARRHRQSVGQGTAAHLAQLLERLGLQPDGEFEGVGLDEDSNVVLTPDQGWLLYEIATRFLPRCFDVPEGSPVDEQCTMPDGVCPPCTTEGRRLLRRTNGSAPSSGVD